MALTVCMILTNVVVPERALLTPTFILVLQHVVVYLKYVNYFAYCVFEIVLEFFFEWAIVSEFERFYRNHWVASTIGATMLISHWMFLAAGLLNELSLIPKASSSNLHRKDGPKEPVSEIYFWSHPRQEVVTTKEFSRCADQDYESDGMIGDDHRVEYA